MFKGVYCPIITAFDSKGNIDYNAEALLVDRLIAHGVDGILFCGSIGEFPSLTQNEKRELFKWAAGYVGGRTKVLAGTGGTCASEVVELTQECKTLGFDGAVVVSPYYFQLDDRAIYDYYAAVAKVGLPIILYNFPQRTQVNLKPELIARLAGEFESIAGIKDTVEPMGHTREVILKLRPIREDFSILAGYDENFVPNLISGGDGVLCGLTNIAPWLFSGIKDAFSRGDMGELCAKQRELNRLIDIYAVTDPFITAIKYAAHSLVPGVGEYIRPPFSQITPLERERIDEVLKCIT